MVLKFLWGLFLEFFRFMVVEVAVFRPVFGLFSYHSSSALLPGMRVRVPFGASVCLGVVVAVGKAEVGFELKEVREVLDDSPLLSEELLAFLRRMARYYQCSLGELLQLALPNFLVQGRKNVRILPRKFSLSDEGRDALSKRLGKKQEAVLRFLAEGEASEGELQLRFSVQSAWLNDLLARGWLLVSFESVFRKEGDLFQAPVLSAEQKAAVDYLAGRKGFVVDALDGVTGSGKTEVYLHRIVQLLSEGGQALLLAPEIGIAKLLFNRLKERFPYRVALYHSALGEAERLVVWQGVASGEVEVLVGTRSALFAPFSSLRGIVIDECHDVAYKQQDRVRYHARDMAVLRAQLLGIPVLMGSATLPLEVWQKVVSGAWGEVRLSHRVRSEEKVKITLDDKDTDRKSGLLSFALIQEIHEVLRMGGQVMVFLNRRGYAPILRCGACAWQADCVACDGAMVVHFNPLLLQCHHCGRAQRVPVFCPKCGAQDWQQIGYGTQRLEEALQLQFAKARILRMDRDNVRSAKAFDEAMQRLQNQEVDIVLGTQWLSKGFHLPNLRLVAIVDCDGALYSSDFRAEEHLAQLLVQVGGRVGREGAGHVWIQTRQMDHAVFRVLHMPYRETLKRLAKERKAADLPPFSAQLLLMAQGKDALKARQALVEISTWAMENFINWQVFGPVPAVMERKDGQHRFHLLCQAKNRQEIQRHLPMMREKVQEVARTTRLRLMMDVDPLWLD